MRKLALAFVIFLLVGHSLAQASATPKVAAVAQPPSPFYNCMHRELAPLRQEFDMAWRGAQVPSRFTLHDEWIAFRHNHPQQISAARAACASQPK